MKKRGFALLLAAFVLTAVFALGVAADPHTHTPGEPCVENKTDPFCTEKGQFDSVIYCTECGEELSRQTLHTEALGHNYATAVTEPTCSEQGYTTYTCNRCGDSYVDNYTEALGHDWGEWMITKEVTTEDGEETRVCRRDPSHVETKVIPAPAEVMTKPDGPTEDEPEKSNAGAIVAVAVTVVVVGGGLAALGIVLYMKKKKWF